MQKRNSHLLSHKGLRYYRDIDFRIYRKLEEKFLTKTWANENDGIRIRELAHQIRNKYYNNIGGYTVNQLNLFN